MLKIYGKAHTIESAKIAKKPEITIKGWIYRKRSSGGKIFAVIHDQTGTLQCVIDKSVVKGPEWESIDKAHLESSIIVNGSLRADERAPGGIEMDVKELVVLHSGEQFPITEYQSTELLLDVRHLWLRSQKMITIMRARSYIFRYAREYLDRNGFYEITPPLITKAGGETDPTCSSSTTLGKRRISLNLRSSMQRRWSLCYRRSTHLHHRTAQKNQGRSNISQNIGTLSQR